MSRTRILHVHHTFKNISWPRYITYSCFRLAAVPVIRSPGCLTKTWYHILNLLIVEGTVIWISSHFSRFVTQLLNALSTPEGRESDLYISFFARNGEEEKGQKEILWQRKVRKYFLDWFTPGNRQGSKHRVFRLIKHNNTARTIDKPIHWKRNLLYKCRLPHRLKASHKATINRGSYFLTSNLTLKST